MSDKLESGSGRPVMPDERLRAAAIKLAGSHLNCEDPWYSCPKSSEGCIDSGAGQDCTCGVDYQIVEIAQALSDERDSAMREAAGLVCSYCSLNDVWEEAVLIEAWRHRSKVDGSWVPCKAAEIRERLALKGGTEWAT